MRVLPERLMPAAHSPYTSWLLHDLDQLCIDEVMDFDFCLTCKGALRRFLRQFITHLQDAIPNYFML